MATTTATQGQEKEIPLTSISSQRNSSATEPSMASTEAPATISVQGETEISHPGRSESASPGRLEGQSGETPKDLGWPGASILMSAETISLGILTLPRAYAALGLVPGVVVTLMLGFITTVTGYITGSFTRMTDITSLPAAVEVMFGGLPGRIITWIAQVFYHAFLIFLGAAHLLAFGIACMTWSDGKGCSPAWTVLSLVPSFLLTLPKLFRHTSWASVVSCISIFVATTITMGAIGHQYRSNPDAHQRGLAFVRLGAESAEWWEVCLAFTNILMSYTGQIAYPTIIWEMRRPQDFRKALLGANIFTVVMYTVTPSVIYYYSGAKTPSPALSAADRLFQQIAYACATPTIVVAGVIAALVSCKGIFETVTGTKLTETAANNASPQPSNHGHGHGRHGSRTISRYFTENWKWISIVALWWLVAYAIAGSVPIFGALLGLMGAVVGTCIVLGVPALMVLYMMRHDKWSSAGWKRRGWTVVALLLIVGNVAAFGFGLAGSYLAIKIAMTDAGNSWSCTPPVE